MVGVAVEVGHVEVRHMAELEKNLIVGLESLLLLAKHLPSVISRFYHASICEGGLSRNSVCPSVCPSVTRVDCDKTK